MRLRTLSIIVLAGFCLLCGGLITQTVVHMAFHPASQQSALPLLQATETQTPAQPAAQAPAPAQPALAAARPFNAVGGTEQRLTIGSTDPKSGFEFQVELDTKGAAVRQATFSEFTTRDRKNPQPQVFLQPRRKMHV